MWRIFILVVEVFVLDMSNTLGLVLGLVLTIAIIAGVIWLGLKGHLVYRSGFGRAQTLKDAKQAEEDIKTRENEILNEARKAELGDISKHMKSLSVDGQAPSICPSC